MNSREEQRSSRQRRAPSVGRLMHELGNDLVWDVLRSLARAPKRVSAIAEELGSEMSAVSKRLKLLSTLGLVEYKRDKNNHVFRVNRDRVKRRPGFVIAEVRASEGATVIISLPLPLPTAASVSPARPMPETREVRRRPGDDAGNRASSEPPDAGAKEAARRRRAAGNTHR